MSLFLLSHAPTFLIFPGVLALAELSCSPSFDDAIESCNYSLHEVLVAENCINLFLSCLPCGNCPNPADRLDVDIKRASLTALANLSETQVNACANAFSDAKCVAALVELTSSNTNQVVRECARFMSNCAHQLMQQGSSLMEKVPDAQKSVLTNTVKRLQSHTDPSCRKHAQDIIAAMQEQPAQ